MGSTGLNTSFFIGFAFLSGEMDEDYIWALNALKDIIRAENISNPGVIVTDRELALMNAITSIFSESKHLLCE